MVVTNRKHLDEDPAEMHDESWWESVLSDEERLAMASSARLSGSKSHGEARRPPGSENSARPRPRPDRQNTPKSHADVRQGKPAHQSEPVSTLSHADWAHVMDVYKQDQIVSLTVTNYNRGGLLVEAERLEGFVPYSHLVDMTCQSDLERDRFLAEYVGRDLRLKIIECVPDEGRIIFSERAARADVGRRTELFSSLQIGDVTTGEVTNITDFGVFVDLGGVEGLIHISELSWGRVSHPSQIVKLGEEIQVQVLEISVERSRVALSLKRLIPNPWEHAASSFAMDSVLTAV